MKRFALVFALALTTGCSGLFPDNLNLGGGCGSSCPVYPGASPYVVRILKGDTVRIAACTNYQDCAPALNPGNTLARWTLASDTVVVFDGSPTPKLVESATSVLVRGIARGEANVVVDFNIDGPNQLSWVYVVDSSTVSQIDLISYTGQPIELHVGTTMSFTARLKDQSGMVVRAWPTAMTVSDPQVLELTITTDIDGGAKMTLRGLKQGTADLSVAFLGVSRVVSRTVQP